MASTLTMDPRNDALDWANSAYLALEGTDYTSPSKFNAYEERPAFASLPPSLLTEQTIERHGQVTPPDDLSPAIFTLKEFDNRESSIPLEQLQPEPSWPVEQSATAQEHEQTQDRPNKRRRTTSKASSSKQPTKSTKDIAPPVDANPPKRRRGRPKNPTNLSSNSNATNGTAMSDNSPPTANRNNHLEKNRQAAYKCRQKKKQYIQNLESRAREYAATNAGLREHVAMLRDEVLVLKNEVLRHAGCGFWGVDEYLARCAGGLMGAPEGYGEMMAMGTPVNMNDLGPMPDMDDQQQDTEDESKPRKDSGICDVEDAFENIQLLKEANDAADAKSQATMARTGG